MDLLNLTGVFSVLRRFATKKEKRNRGHHAFWDGTALNHFCSFIIANTQVVVASDGFSRLLRTLRYLFVVHYLSRVRYYGATNIVYSFHGIVP